MKKIRNIFNILLAFSLLIACEKAEWEPVVKPGDAPAISTPASGTTIVLEKLGADANTVQFTWTKADFGFPSATTYTLELDLAGNSFASPLILATTNDTTTTITQESLNEKLLAFGLEVLEPTDLEFRVLASVSDDVETLRSGTVNLNITLFSSTFPSIYMIGACTGGWDTNKAVEVVSTGDAYQYTTIAEFNTSEGTNFRFFTAPDWGASLGGYDIFTNYPSDLLEPATDDGDPNFNFIGENGWYELFVDESAGTITMNTVDKPVMYLTGTATHGWDWDEPVTEIFWVGYKVWEGDVEFVQNEAFRLFPQKDWDPDSYGWDVIVNYNTEYIDVMEGHNDPNWQFLKPSGTYHVRLDLRNNSLQITEPGS
jgi:hypothetical protein